VSILGISIEEKKEQ